MGAKSKDPFVDRHRATQIAEQTASCRGIFGRNLRNARLRKNLTPDHVCLRTGVNVDTLGAIEEGRLDPSLATMEALADLVGRKVRTLLRP